MVSWKQRMRMGDKDRQIDIFQPAYVDIPIRDQRDLMERPFFSLAKRPRKKPIEYSANGVTVTVTPGADIGMATIWDADILIWAATQVTEALDRGGAASPVITLPPIQPAEGHPPPHRWRPVPQAAGGAWAAAEHGHPHQHPPARNEGRAPSTGSRNTATRRMNRAGRSACRSRCPAGCTRASSKPAAC